MDYADALQQRGTLLKLAGSPEEAEADFRSAMHIHLGRGIDGEASAIACRNDLAIALLDQNRFEEAEPILKEVLTYARRPENRDLPIHGEAVNNLGSLYLARADYQSAEPLFQEAVDVNSRLRGSPHPVLATNLDNLAQALHGLGDLTGAEVAYRKSLSMRRDLYGSEHPDVATSLHNIAVLFYAQGNVEDCEQALRESLKIFRDTYGMAHSDSLTVVDSLVSVLGAQGRLVEAETLLLDAYGAIKRAPDADVARQTAIARRLAALYSAWDKSDLSHRWTETAEHLESPPDPVSTSQSDRFVGDGAHQE